MYQRQNDEQSDDFRVYEADFANIDRISSVMRSRRDLFEDALNRNDPSDLPQCKWLYMGCDYAGICSCRGKSQDPPIVTRDEVEILELPHLAEQIKTKLSLSPPADLGLHINDLVFPRKAALRRSLAGNTRDKGIDSGRIRDLERKGFREELYNAIQYGSQGQFKSVNVQLESMVGKISMYRDIPTILRTSRLMDMVERDRLLSFFSYYFDRLAFECALTNIRQGRLILYYERISTDKFMVYDVTFHSRNVILDEAKRRINLLQTGANYSDLPPCPVWMSRFCEFAPDCGCGN